MNEWKIEYVWDGYHSIVILADTLYMAVEKFRLEFPTVPSLALFSIRCVK